MDDVNHVNDLWLRISGPGSDVAPQIISSGHDVDSNSAQVMMTADGGVTSVWIEYDQPSVVVGPLVSRHWTAAGGWGAIKVIEPSQTIRVRALRPMADGRAMLFYGIDVPGAPKTTENLFARLIEADGSVGPSSRMDIPAHGYTTGWGVHSLVRGNDVVAAWLQEPDTGGFCISSRVFRNGVWSDASCVNATPASKTTFQPRLTVGPDAQAMLAWYGGSSIYVSMLDTVTHWSEPEAAGSPDSKEAPYELFDAAVCKDGSSAIAWGNRSNSGGSLAMRVRSAAGAWGSRVDLARPPAATVEVLKLSVDDTCNWTAVWSTHDSNADRIFARRLLATSGLQATTTLADNVALPFINISGSRYFVGTVALTVEPSGAAIVLWNEQAGAIRWRRLE